MAKGFLKQWSFNMVPFFPELLPDEHIISAIARYHRISGNRSADDTRSILGVPTGPLKPQDVFNRPFHGSLETVSTLVQMPATKTANLHSLAALYRITMSPSFRPKRNQLDQWAQGNTDIPPPHQVMNDRMLAFDKSWQLCPECLLSDQRQFGIPYWHVAHQIPSVTSCNFHHTPLVATALKTLSNLELPSDVRCNQRTAAISNPDWDAWLTVFFSKLQTQNVRPNLDTLKRLITSIWDIPSRPQKARNSRFQQVLEQIEQTVGEQFLSSLFEYYQGGKPTHRGRRRPNFIRTSLVQDASKLRHPIYYLIPLWASGVTPAIFDLQWDDELP